MRFLFIHNNLNSNRKMRHQRIFLTKTVARDILNYSNHIVELLVINLKISQNFSPYIYRDVTQFSRIASYKLNKYRWTNSINQYSRLISCQIYLFILLETSRFYLFFHPHEIPISYAFPRGEKIPLDAILNHRQSS